METWITVVIIPIFIAIFVNILTSSDKIKLPSNKSKIMSYKELLDMHVRKLKNTDISRLEISRRCNLIIEITNTMYKLYLQNCKYESDMVNKLFNVQNQCIIIIDSKKDENLYTSTVAELRSAISVLNNAMDTNYKKYEKKSQMSLFKVSAFVFLYFIIAGTAGYIMNVANGVYEDNTTTLASTIIVMILYWFIITIIFGLGRKLCNGRKETMKIKILLFILAVYSLLLNIFQYKNIQSVKSESQSVQSEINTMISDIAELEDKISAKQDEVTTLQSELKLLEDSLKSLEDENVDLSNKLAELEEQSVKADYLVDEKVTVQETKPAVQESTPEQPAPQSENSPTGAGTTAPSGAKVGRGNVSRGNGAVTGGSGRGDNATYH